MSRYRKENEETRQGLIYGFDHALGYWYEIRDLEKQKDDNEFEEDLIEENDSFSGMKRTDFLELLINWDIGDNHVDCVVLDLPF